MENVEKKIVALGGDLYIYRFIYISTQESSTIIKKYQLQN